MYYEPKHGEVIANRFKAITLLGKGVYSSVVKLEDSQTGQQYAWKVIIDSEQVVIAGKREYSILRALSDADPLNSKHILRVHQELIHGKFYGFLVELMKQNARDTIAKGVGNRTTALKRTQQLARSMLISLQHLKRNSIAHLDLKLDNILIDDKDEFKLGDFSSAYLVYEIPKGQQLMPLFYRAPESFLGYPIGCHSDVWGLACCLYEFYTGRFLFSGKSEYEVIEAISATIGPFSNKFIAKSPNRHDYFDSSNALLHRSSTVHKRLKERLLMEPVPEVAKPLGHFIDLLERMLHYNPKKRIAVEEALQHKFLKTNIIVKSKSQDN